MTETIIAGNLVPQNKGEFSTATTYAINDIVVYRNSSFISTKSNNKSPISDATSWQVLVGFSYADFESIEGAINEITVSASKLPVNVIAPINQLIAAARSSWDTHIKSTGNPHKTTKADIGLGNVDNTADMSKPMSTPQKKYVDDLIATQEESFAPFVYWEGSASKLNEEITLKAPLRIGDFKYLRVHYLVEYGGHQPRVKYIGTDSTKFVIHESNITNATAAYIDIFEFNMEQVGVNSNKLKITVNSKCVLPGNTGKVDCRSITIVKIEGVVR